MQKQREYSSFEERRKPEARTTNQELIRIHIHSKHPLAIGTVTHIIRSYPGLREKVALEVTIPPCAQPPDERICLLILDTCSVDEWPDLLMQQLSSGIRAIVLLTEELASRIHACDLFCSNICAIVAITPDFSTELPKAILSLAGKAMWNEKLTQSIPLNRKLPQTQRRHPGDAFLTAREEQIVTLLRQGLVNRQISMILGISERTVKFHVSNLMQKLRVRGRLELREPRLA